MRAGRGGLYRIEVHVSCSGPLALPSANLAEADPSLPCGLPAWSQLRRHFQDQTWKLFLAVLKSLNCLSRCCKDFQITNKLNTCQTHFQSRFVTSFWVFTHHCEFMVTSSYTVPRATWFSLVKSCYPELRRRSFCNQSIRKEILLLVLF